MSFTLFIQLEAPFFVKLIHVYSRNLLAMYILVAIDGLHVTTKAASSANVLNRKQ